MLQRTQFVIECPQLATEDVLRRWTWLCASPVLKLQKMRVNTQPKTEMWQGLMFDLTLDII